MSKLRLYHRTSVERAVKIYEERRMLSEENTGEAFFSTLPDRQIAGYGDAVVCVEIPEHLAELDDEFPDGEQHYRVHVDHLRAEHFQPYP